MSLTDFIGVRDLSMIYFSCTLISEIEKGIHQKKFYYQEQIFTYVKKQIDMYIQTLDVRAALKSIYRTELNHLLNKKLYNLFKEYNVFACL
ncbi:hypothetical protein EJF36_10465 [Bacillus sp. HMF5848]|uniref:hypothetical protein n=1 Tax=Bacillus sp. HMF5848 TaxID=2495421 RepID=UPI000F79B59F|nr:hypothetical protein [Bacillus sp. HMF5848]RSK27269.1 hypothetical protein EJF36_10465 [Bacillus sp. HMF5848]